MNRLFILLCVFATFVYAERINYWNLGISINKDTQRTVQRAVDIDKFFADAAPYIKTSNNFNEPIFTLETNYLIAPTAIYADNNLDNKKLNYKIKTLILNEEYFEAAKQIINIQNDDILSEFSDLNDFYYWTSFVYYNLENQQEAYDNINMISDRINYPEILFLEALILNSLGQLENAENILNQIINYFPDNDYANYAHNILLEK